MKKTIIIVAGGTGSRMQSAIPKQFLLLEGKPIIMQTIFRFFRYDPEIEMRIVLPLLMLTKWNELCSEYSFDIPHKLFEGGETRFHSVRNGLAGITESSLIGVHDAVRPLVSIRTIQNCYDLAMIKGSAIPVMPLNESIREISGMNSIARHREMYRTVQTPQVFQSEILLKAYETDYTQAFTDDASVVEKAGFPIFLTDGNEENIKITRPTDLIIGEALLKNLD